MKTTMKMKTPAYALAISALLSGAAMAQETKLDYAGLTTYLSGQYGDKCRDKSSSTRKVYECHLIGSGGRELPYVAVEASDDGNQVGYSLTVRVRNVSEIATYNQFYLETVAAVDEWGTPMSVFVPGIREAKNYCFERSELGKAFKDECRYFEVVTDKLGVGFWGSGNSENYGFELIVRPFKTK